MELHTQTRNNFEDKENTCRDQHFVEFFYYTSRLLVSSVQTHTHAQQFETIGEATKSHIVYAGARAKKLFATLISISLFFLYCT